MPGRRTWARSRFTVSRSRSVNGVVTDSTEDGISLVGVGLAIVLVKIRSSFLGAAPTDELTPDR